MKYRQPYFQYYLFVIDPVTDIISLSILAEHENFFAKISPDYHVQNAYVFANKHLENKMDSTFAPSEHLVDVVARFSYSDDFTHTHVKTA